RAFRRFDGHEDGVFARQLRRDFFDGEHSLPLAAARRPPTFRNGRHHGVGSAVVDCDRGSCRVTGPMMKHYRTLRPFKLALLGVAALLASCGTRPPEPPRAVVPEPTPPVVAAPQPQPAMNIK